MKIYLQAKLLKKLAIKIIELAFQLKEFLY